MIYATYDKDGYVNAISDHKIEIVGHQTKIISKSEVDILGSKIHKGVDMLKVASDLKVAIVCNWNSQCGISTYSKYLVDAIKNKVRAVKVFSEINSDNGQDAENIERCWKRGESLLPLVKKIAEWEPDLVIIQHEFGIFPNAFYFMQMMQYLEDFPCAVTLHSTYEHLDKIVYSSSIKNIVVHTQEAKDLLLKNNVHNNIHIIPHGCVSYENTEELWNIFHNPYTVLQFGFGFAYKGVERALEAIHYLKNNDPKFENIFYIYLMSSNEHTKNVHREYYNSLIEKINNLNIQNNVAIIRKYQDENILNLYLRLAKIAIFPYINNPNNTVYASSGAIRIAMANKVPVIASESHLFDDLNGIVPRPKNHIELAAEIDKIFSNEHYRKNCIIQSSNFIENNKWDKIADLYLNLYPALLRGSNNNGNIEERA